MPTRSYIPIQPLSAFDARGDRAPDSPMRRNILKLMAASAALAGAGCSGPPQEVIVPYVDMPERMTPGRPLFYASSFTRRGYAQGVLIESNMGRPTKIEGNPAHPASLGATDIYAQASVLQFWDPDRSQTPHLHGQPAGWAQFETALQARTAGWAANGGDGLRILTGSVGSPTLTAQLQDLLQRYPRAQWHRYDPLRDDRAFEASRMAFGRAVDTVYSTDAAATIVTLDADLFGDWPGGIPHARGFVAGRSGRAPAFANRLYAIESVPTLTGAAADNRLALAPHALARFIRQLAAALGMPGVPDVTAQTAVDERASAWLAALAQRLAAQRGTSLIAAGGSVDPASRALVHCLNEYLGNVGKTVQYIDAAPSDACNHTESIAALAADMHAGRVDALIMLGVNPVYQAPADLAFADALARVPFSVHLGLYRDESAQRAAWHLPQAHFLEAWSDARAWDGTQSIVQPAIAPLYEGRCAHRLLALLSADSARSGHALVRRFWQGRRGAADFESFWETALQKGVIADTRQAALDLRAALPPMRDAMETDVLTVVFTSDPSVADGEFANNGWLQELPQPLTKLTWDNAALIGPGTAAALKLKSGDIVRIALPAEAGRSLEAPVLVLAEQAEGAIALPLGYGRWAAGRVGNGVGFNAYRLRTAAASLAALAVSVAPTGRTHPFAITQADQSMEGRDIVPVASVAAFRVQPAFATAAPRQRTPDATLYPKWDYKNYKWGMAIDLNACIGCNVCSIACQAENNIPIVGKEEVMKGRVMHWIRVDRYRTGSASRSVFLPVPCMHCENAPCEEVCPVGATVHDSEGLNVQVYNRCVGTRFCSNNCPYKVRRFNFLQYANTKTESLKALQNPDVTVRRRGVMEKCSYCLQRITRARTEAEKSGRPLRDGEVITACQAACPTGAIVFGNLNDAGSEVNRAKASPRDFSLLADLNTRPRTTYAARVVNADPELE